MTEAEQNVDRKKIKTAILAAYEGVLAELKKLNPGARPDNLFEDTFEPNPYDTSVDFLVNGEDVRVDFKPRLKKIYGFSYRAFLDKLDVVVGRYPNQKRFPPRKTGVAHADIAAQVVYAAAQQAGAKRRLAADEVKKVEMDEFVHKANFEVAIKHKVGTYYDLLREPIYLARDDNGIKLVIDRNIPAKKLVALLNYAKKELGI